MARGRPVRIALRAQACTHLGIPRARHCRYGCDLHVLLVPARDLDDVCHLEWQFAATVHNSLLQQLCAVVLHGGAAVPGIRSAPPGRARLAALLQHRAPGRATLRRGSGHRSAAVHRAATDPGRRNHRSSGRHVGRSPRTRGDVHLLLPRRDSGVDAVVRGRARARRRTAVSIGHRPGGTGVDQTPHVELRARPRLPAARRFAAVYSRQLGFRPGSSASRCPDRPTPGVDVGARRVPRGLCSGAAQAFRRQVPTSMVRPGHIPQPST